jgi:glycosyltransferase involved in cell wall biosynthesis
LSSRKTVLFYTHALSGGGAERAWSLLASGLAKRGHTVVFAVDYEAEQNLSYLVPGVRIAVLGGGHASTVVRLARLIRKLKPDVTLSALCLSNLKHLAAAGLAGRRDRAIIAYHSFAGGEPQMLSRVSYQLTPLQARLAARTIAVSDALRDDLVARWYCAPKATQRIYNPVVWGDVQPGLNSQDIRARPPLVLASGRLVDGKNFSLLLQAFARMSNERARLVILGEGPKREALEGEVQRLGLGGRVDLPGYVAEPWSYYREASCLVSPSRTESFGMVVVEALAHGLPVICTPTLGPAEVIHYGRYGTLVPHDDVTAMAQAIDAALADPGDPLPRMQHARRFAPDMALDAYEALIEDIVSNDCAGEMEALATTR